MERAQVLEFPLDDEDAVLAAADEDQGFRVEGEDLPADFRADAAAGPGHHDPPPFEQPADVFGVERNGIAAQEVVDFDVADGDPLVAFQPILQGTDDLQVQAGPFAGFHQIAQPPAGQSAGDHQHVGGATGGGHFFDVFQPAENGDLAQPRAADAVVGAKKAAHPVGQVEMRLNLMGENAVGQIGAHQQGPAAVFVVEHRLEHFLEHPPACPHGAQHEDHQDAVEKQDAAGDVQEQLEEVVGRHQDAQRQHRRAEQGRQVGESHVAPPAVELSQQAEDEQLETDHPSQARPPQRRAFSAGQGQAEPQVVGQPVAPRTNTAACPSATSHDRGVRNCAAVWRSCVAGRATRCFDRHGSVMCYFLVPDCWGAGGLPPRASEGDVSVGSPTRRPASAKSKTRVSPLPARAPESAASP